MGKIALLKEMMTIDVPLYKDFCLACCALPFSRSLSSCSLFGECMSWNNDCAITVEIVLFIPLVSTRYWEQLFFHSGANKCAPCRHTRGMLAFHQKDFGIKVNGPDTAIYKTHEMLNMHSMFFYWNILVQTRFYTSCCMDLKYSIWYKIVT